MQCKFADLIFQPLRKINHQFLFEIILPPIKLMGIYATNKSRIINHAGEGSKHTLIVPPIKNNIPIASANFILWLTAIIAASIAPANVPKA